jgi:hypothetical protein
MPDDVQKALVIGDLKMLARITDEDKTAEDIHQCRGLTGI